MHCNLPETMLNRVFPLFLIYLLGAPPAVPPSAITWKQAVVISDIPPFADAGKVYHAAGTWNREHGKYGSEYGRMVKVADNTWLAAYTISRNNGYLYDPKGGLELQVSKSTDNGRTWADIATITDPGRDLDNAQLIPLPDGSILRSPLTAKSFLRRCPTTLAPPGERKSG